MTKPPPPRYLPCFIYLIRLSSCLMHIFTLHSLPLALFSFPFKSLHYRYRLQERGLDNMDYKRMNELRLLGLTIAYYRKVRGMTQMELAEAVHISKTHMSNIEAPNGKTSISLNKLFDIAEALDVSMKDLFDFRDNAL